MRLLIINTDGYGFTAGISRAIEECISFGTVKSLSANINFPAADGLTKLAKDHPDLSIGCHLNPIVGRPVLPESKVPSLLNRNGEFHYREFRRKFLSGAIRRNEIRIELKAQIEKTRDMAGNNFTHVDFHMGLHRLPGLYKLFLELARISGTGRIRTHRYIIGMESRSLIRAHLSFFMRRPASIPKYAWNLLLRAKARIYGFSMPDWWVGMSFMKKDFINVQSYKAMLRNLPEGISEFVAHPAYFDKGLMKWSTYIEEREEERKVLLSPEFKEALNTSGVVLGGYKDIKVFRK